MGGAVTKAGLARLGALALVVAFASSTQDIVVDAWRIESADDGEEQGLLAFCLSVQLPPGAPDYGFRYPHRGSDGGLAHVLRYLRRMYGRWNDRDLVCEGTGARGCDDA